MLTDRDSGFAVPSSLPKQQQSNQQQLVQSGTQSNDGWRGPTTTSLHWFRIDALRLHDNPAFTAAVSSGQPFKAIFIIDPWFNANYNNGPGVNVWRFLLESLKDLDGHLRKHPYNTRLHILIGQPTLLLPGVFQKWNVAYFTFQASRVSYESIQHDGIIEMICQEMNVKVQTFCSNTLYDPKSIIEANNGMVPNTYRDFRRLLPILGKPADPLPEPDQMKVACASPTPELSQEFESSIPTLKNLGFVNNEALCTNAWVGGETEALRRLCSFCVRRVNTASKDPINWLISKDSLSPYIRFGCLSPRQFFSKLHQFASVSTRGQALLEQLTKNLLLREFAFLVGSSSPKFDLMIGNPLCIQLPWDENHHYIQVWREGKTGYPWIDAIIRQCRKMAGPTSLPDRASQCSLREDTSGFRGYLAKISSRSSCWITSNPSPPSAGCRVPAVDSSATRSRALTHAVSGSKWTWKVLSSEPTSLSCPIFHPTTFTNHGRPQPMSRKKPSVLSGKTTLLPWWMCVNRDSSAASGSRASCQPCTKCTGMKTQLDSNKNVHFYELEF